MGKRGTMTDKQIIGGRGSAKPYTALNTIEVMLENEKLKEALKAKEQECEELKKEVDDLLHKPEIQDKILWKIDNKELLLSKDTWIYKLEQTLTEIKEIAEFYNNSNMDNICYQDDIYEILQKISEVEDGN